MTCTCFMCAAPAAEVEVQCASHCEVVAGPGYCAGLTAATMWTWRASFVSHHARPGTWLFYCEQNWDVERMLVMIMMCVRVLATCGREQ